MVMMPENKDVEAPKHAPSRRQTLLVLEEIDKNAAKRGDDATSASWIYSQLASLCSSSIDVKTIYTFCFVCSFQDGWSTMYGMAMVIVALFIQTVVPIAIIATLQPLEGIDVEPRECPSRGNGLTKTIGFVLSLYFVVLTISLCTNKVRKL